MWEKGSDITQKHRHSISIFITTTIICCIIISYSLYAMIGKMSGNTTNDLLTFIDNFALSANTLDMVSEYMTYDEYGEYLSSVTRNINSTNRYAVSLYDSNLRLIEYPNIDELITNDDALFNDIFKYGLFNPIEHPEIINELTGVHGIFYIDKYGYEYHLHYHWIDYKDEKFLMLIYFPHDIITRKYQSDILIIATSIILSTTIITWQAIHIYYVYMGLIRDHISKMKNEVIFTDGTNNR